MKRKIQAGIYKITCLTNNKMYLGSSVNIQQRFYDHQSSLRRGAHPNSYLQNAWNKYNEENFEFSIVEIVEDLSILQDREQHWIYWFNSYKREAGFNLSEKVDQVNYDNHFNAKKWIVTFPNGEELEVKNMEKFCRENNLNRGAMGAVAQGKSNHHKKYLCRYAEQSKEEWLKTLVRSKKSGKGWKGRWEIETPNGERVLIQSLTDFCKKNNLSQGNMTEVANGKRKQHKGFKCSRYLP